MILLLDIGNTRIKSALCEHFDAPLQFGRAVVHEARPLEIFPQLDWGRPSAVWISCVPRLRDIPQWTRVIKQHLGVEPHFVLAQAQWRGLQNSYAQPQLLGVDRWLAMVALWSEQCAPFICVSAGTALTVDRVNAQGQHLGGLIAAGFGTMQRSLLNITRTGHADIAPQYHDGLGRDSEGAIRQGALFSALGVIRNALNAPGQDAGESRVITGGDAATLLPHLESGWRHETDLVLRGLLEIARSA